MWRCPYPAQQISHYFTRPELISLCSKIIGQSYDLLLDEEEDTHRCILCEAKLQGIKTLQKIREAMQ